MKIPDVIDFIGHPLTVFQVDKIEIEDEAEHGTTSSINDQIFIANTAKNLTVSEAGKTETLIHELIHHIDWAFQLRLTERQVLCIARGLLAVIRDNKLDFLSEE
jgi:hypothetical protein